MTLYCDLDEVMELRGCSSVTWDIHEEKSTMELRGRLAHIWDIYYKRESLNTVSYLTHITQWYHSYVDVFGILDYVVKWIPLVLGRATLFLQDITTSVLLNETTATLYTGVLTTSMYLRDIALSIYAKLRQR